MEIKAEVIKTVFAYFICGTGGCLDCKNFFSSGQTNSCPKDYKLNIEETKTFLGNILDKIGNGPLITITEDDFMKVLEETPYGNE